MIYFNYYNMRYNMNTYLNEVYLGKDVIAPLFKDFKNARNTIISKSWTPKINTEKNIIKLNRSIENYFGFNTVTFTILPDQNMNASTLIFDCIMTKSELQKQANSIKSCKQGFRFNKKEAKVDAAFMFNMGLMANTDYTDEETFGILLHEIGHCFYSSVQDKDTIFTCNYYNITTLQKINEKIKNIIVKGIRPTFEQIASDIANLKPIQKIKRVFNLTNVEIVGKKLKRIFFKEDNSSNMKRHMYHYTNEKFADTFAAIYGYGVELNNALMKSTQNIFNFYNPQYYKKSNPITNYIKLNILLSEQVNAYNSNCMDEHPGGLTRINTSIQFIRKELSKQNLDPKLKMQLSKQLNDLQQLVDDFINYAEDDDNMYILREYYKALQKKYGGDIREKDADNDAMFDEIENRYNSLFSKQ